MDQCYDVAYKTLEDNRDKLELMKEALMEYETIDAEQIEAIMKGEAGTTGGLNMMIPAGKWQRGRNFTKRGHLQP